MFINGIITALATPFRADGALDLPAWQTLLQRQLDAGVQAVVVAGSTGEGAALVDDEYDRLLATAVEQVAGRIPVIAGTGLSSTSKTIALTRRAAALGASHALVVTPAYVRPPQAGLQAHYRAVADEGGLPLILYNVPGRTGCDLLPETVATLVDHPAIVGIKDAVSDPARCQALLALRRPGFAVLSGDDGSACGWMLAGADGVVSVGSNLLPGAYRQMAALARAGRQAEAEAWDARLQPYHHFCGIESNPIPIKALLRRAGIGYGVRLPLLPLSAQHHAAADQLVADATALEALSSRSNAVA